MHGISLGDALWGLAWAAIVALGFGLAKFQLTRPARERNRKLVDAATHRLVVQRHGYTLRLLAESGEEIGVQERGRFAPSWYRHAPSFVYNSVAYERPRALSS